MAVVRYAGTAPVAATVVRVYLPGTLTFATIYADLLLTPLGNPFTSDGVSGAYTFFANQQAYDLTLGSPNTGPVQRIIPYVIFSGVTPVRVATCLVDDPLDGAQIILSQQVY